MQKRVILRTLKRTICTLNPKMRRERWYWSGDDETFVTQTCSYQLHHCSSVDEYATKSEQACGKVNVPKTRIPDRSFMKNFWILKITFLDYIRLKGNSQPGLLLPFILLNCVQSLSQNGRPTIMMV